jgi:adenine phosphoribosyltransferase
MVFKQYIESIQDFPKQGILFRDIQPLLEDSEMLADSVYEMSMLINLEQVDYFVGIDSRGFIFASALALQNNKGFKMIRKEGKLPNTLLHGVKYDLEYGSATIEMKPGTGKVVIVDDVYATGGTMEAAEELCKNAGYQVVDKLCLLDIGIVKDHDVKCLISYGESNND